MVHPYTPRQLEYFRSALKIIHSAILDTGMPVGVSENETPTEAIPVVDSKIDTGLVAAHYEPVPVATVVDAPVAIAIPQEVIPEPTIAQPANTEALPVTSAILTGTEVEASTVNAIASSSFFRSIPWQSHDKAVIIEDKDESFFEDANFLTPSATPAPIALNSAQFFRSLPWHTQSQTALLDDSEHVPSSVIAIKAKPSVTPNSTSKTFFQSLPWQGKKAVADNADFVVPMHNNELSKMAELATHTAVQASQRKAEPPHVVGNKSAAHFFRALPW